MTLGFGRSAKTAKSMDEIQGSFATLKDDDVKQATAGPSTAVLMKCREHLRSG